MKKARAELPKSKAWSNFTFVLDGRGKRAKKKRGRKGGKRHH
jgi:hypothetical protein